MHGYGLGPVLSESRGYGLGLMFSEQRRHLLIYFNIPELVKRMFLEGSFFQMNLNLYHFLCLDI